MSGQTVPGKEREGRGERGEGREGVWREDRNRVKE